MKKDSEKHNLKLIEKQINKACDELIKKENFTIGEVKESIIQVLDSLKHQNLISGVELDKFIREKDIVDSEQKLPKNTTKEELDNLSKNFNCKFITRNGDQYMQLLSSGPSELDKYVEKIFGTYENEAIVKIPEIKSFKDKFFKLMSNVCKSVGLKAFSKELYNKTDQGKVSKKLKNLDIKPLITKKDGKKSYAQIEIEKMQSSKKPSKGRG